MKRILVILLIILSMLLCSCSPASYRLSLLNKRTDREDAEDMLEKVIDTINEQDKEALKSLFSEQALSDAENYEDEVDKLFELIEGEIVSWEKDDGPVVDSSNDHGHKTTEVTSFYFVSTDQQTYFFLLVDYTEDTDHPDNVGLYTLIAVKEEYRLDVFDSDNKIIYDDDKLAHAGVYVPTM